MPEFTNNQWWGQRGDDLVPSDDIQSVDSTGWWHYAEEENGGGGYSRICALQDLLNDDGRIGDKLQEWAHDALVRVVCLCEAIL